MEARPVSRLGEHFNDTLEKILKEMRQDLEDYLLENVDPGSKTEGERGGMGGSPQLLEDYLYEVNSFYYRTFHQRLFPLYKEEIKREVSEIYEASRRWELVREDIANNLVRYAQLSNQLKFFISSINGFAGNIEERLYELEKSWEDVQHEIFYSLGELQSQLQDAAGWFSQLEEIFSTPDWMKWVRAQPGFAQVVTRWGGEGHREMNARARNAVNRWLASLARGADSLESLSREAGSVPVAETRKSWKVLARGLAAFPEGLPPFLLEYARGEWAHQVRSQLEKVELHFEIESLQGVSPHRSLQALSELRSYLSNLLAALERTARIMERAPRWEMAGGIWQLEQTELAEIKAMSRLLREFERELENGMQRLAADRDLSPHELKRVVEQAVFRFEREARERLEQPGLKGCKTISRQLGQALESLSLFEVKFLYFCEKLESYLREISYYRGLLELLRSFTESFYKIRNDTGDLLTPRNLQRQWKDIAVQVQHFPIECGERLPRDCQHLLAQFPIERRLVAEEQHLVVLEEKGDLFLVEVDGLKRWEIPYMVVGTKE